MGNYYRMFFNMDMYEDSIAHKEPYIYADSSNVKNIEVEGIKKGFFNTVVLKRVLDFDWPDIEFYYDSRKAKAESDYLGNVVGWPILKKRVLEEFSKNQITGISAFPISLIDVNSEKNIKDYYLVYIHYFIDAFDMEKSQYSYNPKYNFYTFVPHKTHMNYDVCSRYDIFRADKSPGTIFVSEKIKAIIEKNSFSGFNFIIQS